MFHNVNGARLAAKRIQSSYGIRSSTAREMVARAGGWPDWHGLERTVGTVDAPRHRDGGDALGSYLALHLPTARPDEIMKLIDPSGDQEAVSGASFLVSAGAARMLMAMHCGCDVSTYRREYTREWYCVIETHEVAPYTESRIVRRKPGQGRTSDRQCDHEYEQVTETIRVRTHNRDDNSDWPEYGTTPPPSWRRASYDMSRIQRLDNWDGDGGEAEFRDAVMLIRGGLARNGYGGISITDAGRSVAQAMCGTGRRVPTRQKDGAIISQPVDARPDPRWGIGTPEGFRMMAPVTCDQRIMLRPWGLKILIEPAAEDRVPFSAEISTNAARTLSSFLGDAGKATKRTTARFGDVEVVLEGSDGEATLRMTRDHDVIDATFSRAHVRLLRTYLMELAKGARDEIELGGVEVSWMATYAAAPESLAA